MKFLYYDLTFLIIFCLSLAIFLFRHKKNVKIESRVFILYRTKVGLKLIGWVGSRFKKTFRIMSYIVITTGYILMILAILSFVGITVGAIKMPELLKIAKVPPIMPLIPYLPQIFDIDFLPPFYFTYWIIAIAIIAAFHEAAHGIFAKHYNVRVKSTGFGFLGPFLAAFVEPDEKELGKKSKKAQIAVLSAGSFANVIIAIIFIIIIALFFYSFFTPGGMIFETYAPGIVNISSITFVGNVAVSSMSIASFDSILQGINYPDLQIKTNNKTVNLTMLKTANGTYFALTEDLKVQLKQAVKAKKKIDQMLVFEDTPALRVGLSGAITKINGIAVRSLNESERELGKYKPGDEILIESINKNYKTEYYKVRLAERPGNKSGAYLGVGFLTIQAKKGVLGFIGKIISGFKNPSIFYMPKHYVGLTIFVYNLLWWIITINISVAIVNMLPLGIFDGGRVFYLTMLAITKSKKKAEWILKAITWILLALVILLTVMWWIVI